MDARLARNQSVREAEAAAKAEKEAQEKADRERRARQAEADRATRLEAARKRFEGCNGYDFNIGCEHVEDDAFLLGDSYIARWIPHANSIRPEHVEGACAASPPNCGHARQLAKAQADAEAARQAEAARWEGMRLAIESGYTTFVGPDGTIWVRMATVSGSTITYTEMPLTDWAGQ